MTSIIPFNKMTSMEIAEVTGKLHHHIIRDIKDEIEKLELAGISTETKFGLSERQDSTGRSIPYYELTKEGVLQLAARYDAVVRAKLIELAMRQDQLPQPMSQIQILQQAINVMAEQDKRISLVQQEVSNVESRLNKSIEILTEKVERDWKDKINAKINEICARCNFSYQAFRGDLYAELEQAASCNLNTRQKHMRGRMEKAGATYKERQAITKIHVIESDNTLKQIFESIVNKYILKYSD
ncbi:MAG: Rha family transcriptional regulator [Clostridia bacterium]|nr:Rha family transcriptional regulator [Clostridia bacterium]